MDFSNELPQARDPEAFWDCLVQTFCRHQKDIPFALLYSTDRDLKNATGTDAKAGSYYQHTLQRYFGLSDTPSADTARLDDQLSHSIATLFEQATTSECPLIINLVEDPDISFLKEQFLTNSPAATCKNAAICTLSSPSSNDAILGFMILGLSQ